MWKIFPQLFLHAQREDGGNGYMEMGTNMCVVATLAICIYEFLRIPY